VTSKRKRRNQASSPNGRPKKGAQSAPAAPPVGAESTPRGTPPADGPRRWLLAATVVLFVARPLFPSESVAQAGEGIVLVMLSLLLLVAWGVTMIRRDRCALRLGPTDVAVLTLLVLHAVAAVWATKTGNARAALNVLWAWVGLVAGFFLLRQLVATAREARALVAVMIGLGVALASYGFYQYAVELPELRREFARNPEGLMRAEGLWYEPGSVSRTQFEERLNSREPFATFALTNSLAGYLAPWLVVAMGVAALGRWRGAMGIFLVVASVGTCLLLTKSRSAFIAAAVGLALVGLVRLLQRRSLGWKLPLAGLAVAAALVVGAVAVGGLDREVLSEAGKSLGYRLQYWRSTRAMIEDRPWLGCGPGQFKNVYPAYKLPEASEEVADPHNFLLEVWATAGTGAVLALVAVLGCFAWAIWRHGHDARGTQADDDQAKTPEDDVPDGSRWVFGGALAGFLLAWPMGLMGTTMPSLAMLWLGLPLAAAVVFLLRDWTGRGRLPVAVVAIGLVALLVNLLAAGGIGFPGVAGTFWMLLALGLFVTERGPGRRWPRPTAWIITLVGAALAVACYGTTYEPVLSARGSMVAAQWEPQQRRAHLLVAAGADPRQPDCWRQLAWVALEHWRDDHDPESLAQFKKYVVRATELDPASNSAWGTFGDQYLEVYEYTSAADDLEESVAAYRRAIALYPNKAEYHGKLALALERAGEAAAAREEAKTAVRLDDLTPHRDKKLPGKLRGRLLRMGVGP